MNKLTNDDLKAFQNALLSDYGVKLDGKGLYEAAFSLLQFVELLIKFDKEDKNKEKVLKSS